MAKTLVATPDPKRPKITRIEWTNFDEWENGNPRRFGAWVSESAIRDFVSSLSVTEAWDIDVSSAGL